MNAVNGIGGDNQGLGEAQVRLIPARVVEIDSPRFRATPDDDTRRSGALRTTLRVAERWQRDETSSYAFPRRVSANLAFTAQFIAQEVLSEGLYVEDFRPAVRAYAAVASSTRHERPSAPIEIWA